MRPLFRLLIVVLLTVPALTLADDSDLFQRVADRHGISVELLRSIAQVESGMHPWAVNINWEGFRPHSQWEALELIRNVRKRPWLLRVYYGDDSQRMFFSSGQEAQQALQALLARAELLDTGKPHQWEIRKLDVRSVDIGLMQINWKFHGRHFDSMAELFEPDANIDYAARHLKALLEEHGDLEQAVAHYHSNTPEFQARYLQAFRTAYQKQLAVDGSG